MKTIWKHIETWLELNSPELLTALRPGATKAQLRDAEEALGITFPKEIKVSWQIHDGVGHNGPFFLDGYALLSLDEMVSNWKVCQELLSENFADQINPNVDDLIQPRWWDSGWVPLTSDGMGNHHCLDMAPVASSGHGQIISFWHDDNQRKLLAKNFKDYLAGFAKSLQKGDYSLEQGHLVRNDGDKGFLERIAMPRAQSALSLPEAMDPERENNKFLQGLKKKASSNFKLTKDSSLGDSLVLAYWLYVYCQPQAALEICQFLSQVQPNMIQRLPYSSIQCAQLLQARIYKEMNLPAEAQVCVDRVYQEGFVYERLDGSMLRFDWLEEAIEDNKKNAEKHYRFNILRELNFIQQLGGSESWPDQKSEAEIQAQLQALRQMQKI